MTTQNTPAMYYNQLNQMYEAGVANNVVSKTSILESASQSLPNDCKAYVAEQNASIGGDMSSSAYSELLEKYKKDVDFANTLPPILLKEESDYFITKYGETIYNYALQQRELYFAGLNDSMNKKEECPKEVAVSTESTNSSKPTFDANDLYNQFSKHIKILNPDVIRRKIEYRDAEHEKLMGISSLLNWFYYILLFILFLIIFSIGNIHIKERFLIYLGLALLPVLYPWIFMMIKNLLLSFFDLTPLHGPKNAFMDTTDPLLDAYNI